MNNATLDAINSRRATRRFSSQTIEEKLLVQVLETANRAPSGYNLQPWSFILVRNPDVKRIMRHVAMDQPHVEEAPVVVVLMADPDFWQRGYSEMLDQALADGAISPEKAARYRKNTKRLFDIGPFGAYGLIKAISTHIRRYLKPTPHLITSKAEAKAYVRAQTMLAAATLMIAAKSVGLDTCPMEGFDEERLKKLLTIPARMTVPIMIPIGYALESEQQPRSVRVPLNQKLYLDLFNNPVKRIKVE